MLLLLANFGKEGEPEPILAKISQETLAEMIGTTRSRVSFFMNKFRKLGLIDYNGRIEVHRSLFNVVLHEQPHINSMSNGRVLKCVMSASGHKRTFAVARRQSTFPPKADICSAPAQVYFGPIADSRGAYRFCVAEAMSALPPKADIPGEKN